MGYTQRLGPWSCQFVVSTAGGPLRITLSTASRLSVTAWVRRGHASTVSAARKTTTDVQSFSRNPRK